MHFSADARKQGKALLADDTLRHFPRLFLSGSRGGTADKDSPGFLTLAGRHSRFTTRRLLKAGDAF